MKKFILLVALVIVGTFSASAQRHEYGRDNRMEHRHEQREYRRDRREERNWGYQVYNEKQYVRVGRIMYLDTYETTVSGGRVVQRVRISREPVNFRRGERRPRFNVFLRF